MDFLKCYGLMGIGEIPYNSVHFEQGFFVLWEMVCVCQITDHYLKTHPKSDYDKYFSCE